MTTQSLSDKPKPAPKTMEELLRSYKTSFSSYKKGDKATGKITKLTHQEILVDINSKSEAVVLEKDRRILKNILSLVKEGDEVIVSVLDPESDKGHPVVSLRRFIDDKLWKKLEEKKEARQEIELLINESTKGGLLVSTEQGLSGFLPNSHLLHIQNQQEMIGKKIKAFILELARPERKIILSQKPVLRAEDFDKSIKTLTIDQKIDTIISNITSFGLFVTLQNQDGQQLDGLIHISEISWDKVENISDLFCAGQKVQALIIGFDKEGKRVDLSIKRLTKDPFEELAKNLAIDQKIKGKVERILPTGVLLKFEPSELEGFIRKEKIPPTVSYEVGEEVNTTISQIDKKRHRIIVVPVLTVKPIGYK